MLTCSSPAVTGICDYRSGEPVTSGQQEKLQLLREERLGANLKALLRRWVEGDQTGFRVSVEGLAGCGPKP